MKSVNFKLVALTAVAAVAMAAGAASAQTVIGGGASLPAVVYNTIIGGGPILGAWTYASSSSGTGKANFLTGSTFNYAGSDSALTSEDLATYTTGATWGPIIQVPIMATALLLPYKENNGTAATTVSKLNLTTAEVCRIFSFSPAARTWNQITTAADDGAAGTTNMIQLVFEDGAGSGPTEILSRFLNASCGPFLPAGKSFTMSNKFRTMVASAITTLTAAQDANGDGIPDVWVPVANSSGMTSAVAANHRLGYSSPDPVYTGNSDAEVARINGLRPTVASIQSALPAPPSGAARQTLSNWVPAYSIPIGAYPIWGTTNLLVGQCYAGGFGSGTRGAAVKNFLQNLNNGTYDSYITSHNFVNLPAAWNSAIAEAFLTGVDGNGLAFGNAADCASIPGRP
ncbi:ABC-type phosphate transport system, substrate-binding protein [Variovorax sp. PDC80]|uniref:substrate-binding domain-containing protein n=1 Tax=Variovorax sp. PDC80 TaxID=1882827 RepID=UPI0008ECE64B|nr:substrate-binding domain-containing protein [Variovorax sp. PDC80]SFO83869.1 ABC-type phosphate transport system, substrate-binding protein [Variovorax sp. PDC80]